MNKKYTEDEMKTFYRRLFSSELGKIVYNDILHDLHYFDLYLTEDNLTLNNYAKVILWKTGVLDNPSENIINKLFELEPVYTIKKNEENGKKGGLNV